MLTEILRFGAEVFQWVMLVMAALFALGLMAAILCFRFVVPVSAILFAGWLVFFDGWAVLFGGA